MQRQAEPEFMDLAAEAEAYAMANFGDVNEAFVARLLELVGEPGRAVAVDLGTGPGDIPLRLLRARPRWRVVAVDAAFPMLEFARASRAACKRRRLAFVQADAKTLPFSSAFFDVAFSNSILHHITDTPAFWSELKRVAKPSAWVFLRDLSRPDDEETARYIVARYAGSESELLQEEYYRSLLSAYTPAEVRAQLDQARLFGLDVTQATDRHLDVFGRLRKNPEA